MALAADSKVSIGYQEYGKTYDTVNKLFTLSKYHPVGVMVYGNAAFMSYPWETVIKLYRQSLGSSSKQRVEDYARDFVAHLTRDYSFTFEEEEEIISQHLLAVHMGIEAQARDGAEAGDYHTRIMRSATDFVEDLNRVPDVFPDFPPQEIGKLYRKAIDRVVSAVYEGKLALSLKRKLRRLSALVLGKSVPLPGYSGLVVTGFGDKEKFPSLRSFEIDGVIAGRLKFRSILKNYSRLYYQEIRTACGAPSRNSTLPRLTEASTCPFAVH